MIENYIKITDKWGAWNIHPLNQIDILTFDFDEILLPTQAYK